MAASILLFFLSPLLKWVTLTGVIGVAGVAGFFLLPANVPGFWRRLSIEIGVGAFVVGGFYWYAFRAGETHMAQLIAAKDAAAVQRVKDGEREVEACGGGVDWDVTSGLCRPGANQ